MQPIYVSKTLSAASSNGIGSVSTAVPSVVTLNTSNLDTGRRIVFTSTAADTSSLIIAFTGLGEQRSKVFSESVKGSTAGAGTLATTTSDFLSVQSISISSNANIPILIGTSSVGGTQWKLANWHISPQILSAGLTFSSTTLSVSGSIEFTNDDPTLVYANPTSGAVPTVFTSTSHVSGPSSIAPTGPAWGAVNNDGAVSAPIAAWRLTITSTSSGSVFASVIQAGIG